MQVLHSHKSHEQLFSASVSVTEERSKFNLSSQRSVAPQFHYVLYQKIKHLLSENQKPHAFSKIPQILTVLSLLLPSAWEDPALRLLAVHQWSSQNRRKKSLYPHPMVMHPLTPSAPPRDSSLPHSEELLGGKAEIRVPERPGSGEDFFFTCRPPSSCCALTRHKGLTSCPDYRPKVPPPKVFTLGIRVPTDLQPIQGN